MSPSIFREAETQWLAQLKAMRDALAELKPPELPDGQAGGYGHDIDLEETDPSDLSSSDGNIWDSDLDHEGDAYLDPVADGVDSAIFEGDLDVGSPSPEWLTAQCADFAGRNPGLNAIELQEQILAILASDKNELQSLLTDVLGFDDLALVMQLLAHRKDIVASGRASPSNQNGVLGRLHTKQEREEALRRADYEHKHAALGPNVDREGAQYPHVYKSHQAGNMLTAAGKKYALPVGSERTEHAKYEEYSIPATRVGTIASGQKLVQVAEMDGLCSKTFKGYKALNRMQSLVYPVAYHTSENMLICAPTGAGKTDAAMLTILNTIAKHITPNPLEEPEAADFVVQTEAFKVVYVAPMKALAAEITEKLGRRLAWLGVRVRELTGDMHLTKTEIVQTQVIITTPEKWDVVTRKSSGDTELVQKVRLLIIDEVHMLHDERGAVIESLVARTQRQVESTQSLIRIVGLSATLPNYIDVADFLKVNRMAGLFYFDASFRPVPLEQHFIGVKGKAGTRTSKENLELASFDKVKAMLERGHQVMVFVHSRKDTLLTAKTLHQMAIDQGCTDLFLPEEQPGLELARRDMAKSKARELRDIFQMGLGIHHAGMARSNRNLMERLFAEGHIQVLCCTATLAWGVNLPAAAVVIKGTQLYSAQEGKFVDLGILDVLQIFGRAGRPQFQDTGIGFIVTTHDKLVHYLSAVTQQQPIESRFSARLVDNLNAEIALGTVTSVSEAVQWVGYSYLFVRMQRSPLTYGIDWAEIRDDSRLVLRRREMIIKAARILQQSQMIIFNETTEELRSKDIGRIASQFYILQTSIEIFNTMMRPQATEADVLKMISMSGEFDNIQSRDNEAKELSRLRVEAVPCQVDGGIDQPHAKTNILLQSYISQARVEDFALVSDTAYVAQNAARICRALFMIALNRRWGYQCLVLLSLSKSIEKRIWPYQHALHQFDLPQAVLRNLDEKHSTSSIDALRDMEPAEIGQLVHNNRMGITISHILEHFPTLSVEAEIAPLNRDILRMRVHITADFRWNDRHNGTSESYWIMVENSETSEIYHHEFFLLTRKKLHHQHELDFTIPLSDPLPSQIYVRAVSDRWLGAETVTPVSFQHLIRPDTESVYTDLLNLQPLPVSALKNPLLEEIYGQRFQYFNPMQTQIFHCLYHTPANVLLGSPTGSGKTIAAELAMWWAFREKPGCKVVYIAPMKALVRERVSDWRARLTRPMGLKLVELTGDNTPDTRTIRDADIIITTPEKWDGISRSWQTRGYVRQVGLVIIDEIHLLGGDRGPILEIIVSRMNYIAAQTEQSVRIVGMSTACANAMDLGNWLGVKEGLFNFRHSVRPVPLEIYIDGFPEQRGFCPLMQSMNRPTFLAIKNHSPDKPTIVFVPSRRQTRLTARDLINYCGMEDNPRRFLKMSEDDLQVNLSRVTDESLREALTFGIGLHHAGLVESDRQLAEELFANNKIQVLVATSTLAWGVNLPAHLVIVKGTQFFDAKIEGYKDADLTDVLQMLGRAGRPQFDSSGVARIFTQEAKKAFYKHFLHTGFPVESSLHNVLDNHLGAEVSARTINTKQDALDYLTWTFFFRRLHKNPSFYGLEISGEDQNTSAAQIIANSFMIDLVDKSLNELALSKCITAHSNGEVEPTALGKITSYYYLSHRTVRQLVSKAKRQPKIEEALSWMCCASEYDELPVRHNEDLINAELSKNLAFNGEVLGLPMWDPHVKAFLLIQAFLSRIGLPITDYVTDQNSVLDQSIRIIQASIDVLAELGFLSSCMSMMTLLQCIKCARWPTDHALSIFPGVQPQPSHDDSRAASSRLPSLVDVPTLSSNALNNLMDELSVPQSDRTQFIRVTSMLPQLKMFVPEASAIEMNVSIFRQNTPSGRPSSQIKEQAPPPPSSSSSEIRVWAPHFPKPQTEGFFVIVADEVNDEIIALKRVTWPILDHHHHHHRVDHGHDGGEGEGRGGGGGDGGGGDGGGAIDERSSAKRRGGRGHMPAPTIKATLKIPPSTQSRRFDVLVVSDAYIGMQWRVNGGVHVPGAPTFDDRDDGGKGKKGGGSAR